MDRKKVANPEDRLNRALEGEPVSRRWMLKSTANMAAATIAVSALGAAPETSKSTPTIGKRSAEHDPHADHEPAYSAAAFEGWESV